MSVCFQKYSKTKCQRASPEASKQDINISRGEFYHQSHSGDMVTQKDTERVNQSSSNGEMLSQHQNKFSIVEQSFWWFGNYNTLKNLSWQFEQAKFQLNKLEQEVLLNAVKAYYSLGYVF